MYHAKVNYICTHIAISHTFNISLSIKLRILKDEVEPKDEKESKKPRLNLSNQVQMLFLTKTDADFSVLYLKLEDNIQAEVDENKLQACKD